MRHEPLFNHSGHYGFVLESNVLLHREATESAIQAFGQVLYDWPESEPVAVLDLDCGGWPVTMAEVMEAYPEFSFSYTGVDINPDQVALAGQEFPFPENVVQTRLVEGNAWELEPLKVDDSFQLIFSDMNLHHGTPEEIYFLGLQVRERLGAGGIFFSHDVYRPDAEVYRPRPNVIDGETSWLVSPARLAWAEVPRFETPRDNSALEPPWRNDYIERMRTALIARGGDPAGAEGTAQHMRTHDFPISTRELRTIMEDLGFDLDIQRYDDSGEPLGPYVATVVAMQANY
jgi:hypothetical protein